MSINAKSACAATATKQTQTHTMFHGLVGCSVCGQLVKDTEIFDNVCKKCISMQQQCYRQPSLQDDTDWDGMARRLFKHGPRAHHDSSNISFRDLDPIWSHPTSGASVYVGNMNAASNLTGLQDLEVAAHPLPCASACLMQCEVSILSQHLELHSENALRCR